MRYAYIRVSTKDQNLDRQIEAIKEYRPVGQRSFGWHDGKEGLLKSPKNKKGGYLFESKD